MRVAHLLGTINAGKKTSCFDDIVACIPRLFNGCPEVLWKSKAQPMGYLISMGKHRMLVCASPISITPWQCVPPQYKAPSFVSKYVLMALPSP